MIFRRDPDPLSPPLDLPMKRIVKVHVESDSTIIINGKVTINENKRYGEFAHCVLIVEKAILAGLAIGGSTLYSIIF